MNLTENQKKAGDLEAREPSEFLGQEGPILADGNKTRPRSKGIGKTKGFASGNRSVFSPGPRASVSENLEDEITTINPSSCAPGDSNSQSILELSAGERPILNGTEMAEILGPTAEPLIKRPFPPVDRKSNKRTEIESMDIDRMELNKDQGKIKGTGEMQPLLENAGRIGGGGKLDENPDRNHGLARPAIIGRMASEVFSDIASQSGNGPMRNAIEFGGSGGQLEENFEAKMKERERAMRAIDELEADLGWESTRENQVKSITRDFGGSGGQLDEKVCSVRRPPELDSKNLMGGIIELASSPSGVKHVIPGLELGNAGSSNLAGEKAEAEISGQGSPASGESELLDKDCGTKDGGSLSMELEGAPGATGDPVGEGEKGGLGLRAPEGALDAGRLMEDQDPIKGRLWLEALDLKRDR